MREAGAPGSGLRDHGYRVTDAHGPPLNDSQADARTPAEGSGSPLSREPFQVAAGRTQPVKDKECIPDADLAPPEGVQGDAAHYQVPAVLAGTW